MIGKMGSEQWFIGLCFVICWTHRNWFRWLLFNSVGWTDKKKGEKGMKKLIGLAALAISLGAYASVNATVVDFEDTNPGGFILPDGYQGFNWNNDGDVQTLDGTNLTAIYTTGYTNLANALAGDMVAYNLNGAYDVVISSVAATFDLNSAWFAAAWYPEMTLEFTGSFLGGTLFSTTEVIDRDNPGQIDFNWAGIDTLTISYIDNGMWVNDAGVAVTAGDLGAWEAPIFAMDNMTVNEPIPEPATMLLFGTGIIALAGYRRRRTVK